MPKAKLSQIYDIAIVGGGPSGRIAALTLAQNGFSCVLVAPRSTIKDGRTTALWQRSIELLQEIGVWDELANTACELKKMRMIDDTGRLIRAPEVVFDSAELGMEVFGFNILNHELNKILEKHCDAHNNVADLDDSAAQVEFGDETALLTTKSGQTIEARLVVAADGRNSVLRETAGIPVRRWSYPQVAVVLNLEHRLPHQHISTEFHTPTGPFTLVPLPGRQSSLVCVETAEGAEALLSLEDHELEFELERRAHSILGRFSLASKPQSFPLSGLTAQTLVKDRLALVGETAHVFPPIGAQGLNLSLRDVLDLSGVLLAARMKHQDIGREAVLKAYDTKRASDIRSRTNAVDALNRSLLTDFLPVQAARSISMHLAERVGPFRRMLMREGLAPGSAFGFGR
ncbi:2-octaprenyl-3-methyl-6-methoxy-1,4-benzoquinol hydroxylase [Labrenzia sp. THAF82]|uniref:UbiH/UbiF family hydroxylase n=1 Tax=Labrenzia sp. THAF82 TaxID=2587861 RepID=UPI0012697442|nr:UbiH/UbiF family hydroxylase [Labrenzia sp. THAF82]QFT32160.1 2-octaprenyl-3-methyl-6-methoxy-1,4-benzoquinol hydroxylase [Labrenzia sp. THAF82]